MRHWERVRVWAGWWGFCAVWLGLVGTARAAGPVQPVIRECGADFRKSDPDERSMKMTLRYKLSDAEDEPADAISATDTIELWLGTAFTNGDKPTFAYLATVYPWSEGDDADRFAPRTGSGARNVPADGSLGEEFEFPIPEPAFSINAEASEKYYYLRVRSGGELQKNLDARQAARSCLRPDVVRFRSPGFKLIGGLDLLDPWGLGGSCDPGSTPHCQANAGVLQNVEDALNAADAWQRNDLGLTNLGYNDGVPFWAVGDDPDCTFQGAASYCPSYVLLTPRDGNTGNAKGAIITLKNNSFFDMDRKDGNLLRVLVHESFHVMHAEAQPSGVKALPQYAREGQAAAAESVTCLEQYDPDFEECVAPWNYQMMGAYEDFYAFPSLDIGHVFYDSSVLWRYFAEQFGLPVGAPSDPIARPSGKTSSNLEAIPGFGNLPLSDRRPDEGMDFFGYYYDYRFDPPLDENGDTPSLSAFSVADAVLKTRLGRSRKAMVTDFHSAALLKDYRVGDNLRWRIHWTPAFDEMDSRDNLKELNGPYIDPDLRPDGLRMVQTLNRQEFTELPVDGTVANAVTVQLNGYGAGYLRINPNPATEEVEVLLKVRSGAPLFRIFTVDDTGLARLHPGCDTLLGDDEDDTHRAERCEPDESGEVRLSVDLESGADRVVTLLMVASSPSGGSSFDYAFQPGQTVAEILSPTGSSRPIVGSTADGSSRPFLMQFAIRNGALRPITGIEKTQLRISVDEPPGSWTELEPTVLDLMGGSYYAWATVPPSLFPSTPGDTRLSLKLEYLSARGRVIAEDVNNDVLVVTDEARPTVYTQLLLDRSDSMNDIDGGKLTAMKEAARFLIDTIPEDDRLGLMVFDHDADTRIRLKKISDDASRDAFRDVVAELDASGCTSIGDALFEAQSNIYVAHEDPDGEGEETPDLPEDAIHEVFLLSDGINTNGYDAFSYYSPNPEPFFGTKDGNQVQGCGLVDPNPNDDLPWTGGSNLPYFEVSPSDYRPRISTIAFGPNADAPELDSIGKVGKGISLTAPGLGGAEELNAMSIELKDGFRMMATSIAGGSRVGSQRVDEWSELSSFQVEDGAARLQVSLSSRVYPTPWDLRLQGPDGVVRKPVLSDERTLVFVVDAPVAGEWQYVQCELDPEYYDETCLDDPPAPGFPGRPAASIEPSPPGAAPYVFVEESVHGVLSLFALANVELTSSDLVDVEAEQFVGKDVIIRAVPVDGAPVLGAALTATVVSPSGEVFELALKDLGKNADGAPGDGVYAAKFRQGYEAGAYSVRVVATGVGANVGPFQRETLTGFELHPAPDDDGDGISNPFDIEPDRPNAFEDPDQDLLSNLDEFEAHTDPLNPDTDGGGETDGSEVNADPAGNPLDPNDDLSDRLEFDFFMQPCAGEVLAHVDTNVEGLFVEIQSSTDSFSGFSTFIYQPVPQDGPIVIPVPDGEMRCYRARLENAQSIVGPWVAGGCVTPAQDPRAPRLEAFSVPLQGPPYENRLRIRLEASDEISEHDLEACPTELTTGVTTMWISMDPDFEGASAQPFVPEIEVALTEQDQSPIIWVKVADGAGNESRPVGIATSDRDGDGVVTPTDNCVFDVNPDQADFDRDGAGDLCDPSSLLADAGGNQTVECQAAGAAVVTLDGSSSGALEGDVAFVWTAPVALAGGDAPIATGIFPVGTHEVTLVVGQGDRSVDDTAWVTVLDTAPPVLVTPPDVQAATCGSVYLGQPFAHDACGEVVAVTNDAPASFRAGITTVTWQAEDAYGNVSFATQRVAVSLGGNSACCPVGSNIIIGTSNNDTLNGTSGPDCIIGLGAQDIIDGKGGNDVLSGGDGNDQIVGGGGDDFIEGGSGQDVLSGGTGGDALLGGDGDDSLSGGSDDDVLFGGQGQDQLHGGGGADSIYGEIGDDDLFGEDGDDLLDGGGLHDDCDGGPGANQFVLCENVPDTLCRANAYEAEGMTKSTGGAIANGWNIWSNGYVSTSQDFTPGPNTIWVTAKGELAGGEWPHAKVVVNGVVAGEFFVETAEWTTIPVPYVAAGGAALIRVEFDNDYYGGAGSDRNLHIDKLFVTCGAQTESASCSDGPCESG